MPRLLEPMKISLTNVGFAEVDDADAALVENHAWSRWTPDGGFTYYAVTRINGERVYMHRLLAGVPGLEVDHRNGDGLDNRRANLRPATHAQNQQNKAGARRPGQHSRFKGVTYFKPRRMWVARIKKGGKVTCHYFHDEVEAAREYDRMAQELFGEFARLNFPGGTP